VPSGPRRAITADDDRPAGPLPLSIAGRTAPMTAAAVLYVRDLTTMRGFYEACFGMSAEEPTETGFCVLAKPAFELSLVRVPGDVADAIEIEDPPRRRTESPVKLVFDVTDLGQAAGAVVAAGGQVDVDAPAWSFRGGRYRDCVDPEGNVVQLREPAAR
jgi:predicted enzyme related to lactoylglutathione lyase